MNWNKIPVIEPIEDDVNSITVAYFRESEKQHFFAAMHNYLFKEQDWVIFDLGTGVFELAIRYKIEIYTGKKK